MKKPIKSKRLWKQRTWVKFQPTLHDNCVQHYACFLWNTGSQVRMRKFLFIKWLEFTKQTYYQA